MIFLFSRNVDFFWEMWTISILNGLRILWFSFSNWKPPPYVRESKRVLDSGIHAVYSRFQVLDSGFLSVELGFCILIVSGIPQLLFIIAFNRGRAIKVWTRMTGIYIVSLRIIDDRHKILSKRSEFKLLRFPLSKMPHPRISVKLKQYTCSRE